MSSSTSPSSTMPIAKKAKTTKTITSCQDFWDNNIDMIKVTEQHPFLVQMVNGTLNVENFKYYVKQDVLYLNDFADCLERLSKTAPTKEYAERLMKFSDGAKQAEMSLHKSFFKQWNITDDDDKDDMFLTEQMPNCLLYTSYMKRVITTESHVHGLAVLLPCFWVYMHVGKCMLQLREELKDTVTRLPQYDAWIDMYGGDEFEKEVNDYIAMVNDAITKICNSDEYTSEKKDTILKEMEKHFQMCCKLEHMFWDQASNIMTWPQIG